jgi:hypothetical protein
MSPQDVLRAADATQPDVAVVDFWGSRAIEAVQAAHTATSRPLRVAVRERLATE